MFALLTKSYAPAANNACDHCDEGYFTVSWKELATMLSRLRFAFADLPSGRLCLAGCIAGFKIRQTRNCKPPKTDRERRHRETKTS
jgi:hypothetical protein